LHYVLNDEVNALYSPSHSTNFDSESQNSHSSILTSFVTSLLVYLS